MSDEQVKLLELRQEIIDVFGYYSHREYEIESDEIPMLEGLLVGEGAQNIHFSSRMSETKKGLFSFLDIPYRMHFVSYDELHVPYLVSLIDGYLSDDFSKRSAVLQPTYIHERPEFIMGLQNYMKTVNINSLDRKDLTFLLTLIHRANENGYDLDLKKYYAKARECVLGLIQGGRK